MDKKIHKVLTIITVLVVALMAVSPAQARPLATNPGPFPLEVTKTAEPYFNRVYTWTIDKTADQTEIKLSPGEIFTVNYAVTVDATYVDSGYGVRGSITIHNPTGNPANITDIYDWIYPFFDPDLAPVLNCGEVVSLPYVLAAGATLICTYDQAMPGAGSYINKVMVQTYDESTGVTTQDFGFASFDFTAPVVNAVDECIDLSDTLYGDLGTVCAGVDALPKKMEYSRTFSTKTEADIDLECGLTKVDNTVSIKTNDTHTITSDTWTVTADAACQEYELSVNKTAVPHLTRTYTWNIDKSADWRSLLLSAGQVGVVNYGVTVGVNSPVDSAWGVTGEINIYNPSPTDTAVITGVTDVVSPAIAAAVSCPASEVTPLGTLKCTYSADLPDGTTRTNTATVTTSGKVGGGSGSANVDFSSPATVVTEMDECVNVSDTLYGGALGKVCVGDAPRTFNYSKTFSTLPGNDVPLSCGENKIDNIASFVTNDTSATGQDTWRVTATVACEVGCTLTQGYWKTHSELGPAPYDPAWGNLGALEEQTPFFLSGNTWYGVFWTAPAGNVYYNLAHQYMAAKLNILDGASTTPAVDASITVAETLFGTTTPAQTAKIKNPDRQVWVALASILDQYNNGYIGPGHCSE